MLNIMKGYTMKYTKTTLRELSARYRTVLKKCFLLNALALGLIAPSGANAALTADDLNQIANSISTGYVEAPNIADYLYDKDGDGSKDTAIDGSLATVDDSWYSFDLSDGTQGNAGTTVTNTDTRYQFTAEDGSSTVYDASSSTVDASKYSWTSTGGSTTALTDADIGATALAQTGYTYTDYNGDTKQISNGKPQAENYTFTNSAGENDSLKNYIDAEGTLTLPASEVSFAATAVAHYDTDNTNYNASYATWQDDETAYLTATGKLDNDIEKLAEVKQNFSADEDALASAKGLRDTAQSSLNTVNSQYTADKTAADAYADSLGKAVDTKADGRITASLEEGGAVKNAIDNVITNAKDYTDTTVSDAINDVMDTAEQVFAEKQAWVDNTLGINSAEEDAVKKAYSGTTYLGSSESLAGADIALDKAIATNADGIAANKAAIIQEVTDRNTAISAAITQEVTDRDAAIKAATTMEATAGNNYEAGSSVISAIKSIDANMGKIHGLVTDASATTTATGKAYAGNLAVGTTVEDHLVALDGAIGDMRDFASSNNYATSTNVAANLTALDGQVKTNADGIAANKAAIGTTSNGTYVSSANTVGQNINALDTALGDVRSDMATTQAHNNARFAQINNRIDKLEDTMEKGLAANNALAGLVPLDHTHKTQISAALGGYKSNQALAVGAFHYLNSRTLLNAGAAYGGNSSVSYKVGVTFGF